MDNEERTRGERKRKKKIELSAREARNITTQKERKGAQIYTGLREFTVVKMTIQIKDFQKKYSGS